MSAKLGRYEDIVALAPQHATLLDAIRALVVRLNPDVVEVARLGDRAVSWGWGRTKMSEAYVYALPYTAHVNLGFYQGAHLPDPAGLLTGTGKKMRHVSLTEAGTLTTHALHDLIRSAADERRAALTN